MLIACEYGPMASGAPLELIWVRGTIFVVVLYAALVTRFERMQRVQTRIRLTPPFTTARTRWIFASNLRLVTLCA